MNSIRRAGVAALALALIALTACTPMPGGADYSEFEGIAWELVSGSVDGEALPDPISLPVTVTFEEVNGATSFVGLACNSLIGQIGGWPHGFSVGGVDQTDRGCPNDNMLATEEALAAGIVRVNHLEGDASEVVLTGDGVEFTLRAADEVDRQADIAAALEGVAGRQWLLIEGTVDYNSVRLFAEPPATMSVTVARQTMWQG